MVRFRPTSAGDSRVRALPGLVAGQGGFTLIEMVGVLGVLAILAGVLIPKVFDAIHSARIATASSSCDTIRVALVDHYGKYGSFLVGGSPPGPLTLNLNHYDQVLISEGLLDKPFAVKIGDQSANTRIEAVSISGGLFAPGIVVDGTDSTGFALSGGGTNTVAGSVLVVAVITGVTAADAKELNDRVDGPALGAALNSPDLNGQVKYDSPINGTTTVYVYLTHR